MTLFFSNCGPCLQLRLPFSEIEKKKKILDQPTVVDGGVSRGRSVAAAVGCWLLALQRYFNAKQTKMVLVLLSGSVKRVSVSVGLFESFGNLLGFVQNRKSMQTLSFVLFKFWFQNKD